MYERRKKKSVILQRKRKKAHKKNDMEKKHQFEDIAVSVYTQHENVAKRVIRGRALLDDEDKRMTFVENEQRKQRSKELGRTALTRVIRCVNGGYSATIRVNGDEKYLRELLVADARNIADYILKDVKEQKAEKKKAVIDKSKQDKEASNDEKGV